VCDNIRRFGGLARSANKRLLTNPQAAARPHCTTPSQTAACTINDDGCRWRRVVCRHHFSRAQPQSRCLYLFSFWSFFGIFFRPNSTAAKHRACLTTPVPPTPPAWPAWQRSTTPPSDAHPYCWRPRLAHVVAARPTRPTFALEDASSAARTVPGLLETRMLHAGPALHPACREKLLLLLVGYTRRRKLLFTGHRGVTRRRRGLIGGCAMAVFPGLLRYAAQVRGFFFFNRAATIKDLKGSQGDS
jgi:hypothetical protein